MKLSETLFVVWCGVVLGRAFKANALPALAVGRWAIAWTHGASECSQLFDGFSAARCVGSFKFIGGHSEILT